MLHDLNRQLELADRLETNYLRVLYYEFPEKISDSYKTYEYARFCTILQGEKHISVNRSVGFQYSVNDFLLLPPRSDVFMTIGAETIALVFELSDALVSQVSENICMENDFDYSLLTQDQILCTQKNPALDDILGKIQNTLAEGDKNLKYILDLYAQEMVYHLIRIKGVRQVLNLEMDNPVSQAIRLMKDQCMSSVSIGDIISNLGMSESNFCQYFKKITGISPKEYLTNIKMEKARELIGHTSVTETAYDLGYENISHFISQFKNKFGKTPKQYQKLIPH
jgi:AraC-type DNA-binding domain-containing proteins